MTTTADRHGDAYRKYLRGFFARWNALYDVYALPVVHAYRAAARAAVPTRGTRVLDLCTGTGELARRLVRAGGDVTGVDFTPEMLLYARRKQRRHRFHLLEMDARSLAFGDGAFDTVTLSFALHDMPREARTASLQEAARVGRQALVVLDYELPRRAWARRFWSRILRSFETAYLPRFLERGGVAAALAEAGLAVPPPRSLRPGPFALWVVPLAARVRVAAGSGAADR